MSRGGGIKDCHMGSSDHFVRFIVWCTIGLEFKFITFILQFFLAQMSFLLMSSSAIYSSTFSNHTYVSVSLKGIMHQGSALCPLLFGVVMGVVPSEASSGIPFELLYASCVRMKHHLWK